MLAENYDNNDLVISGKKNSFSCAIHFKEIILIRFFYLHVYCDKYNYEKQINGGLFYINNNSNLKLIKRNYLYQSNCEIQCYIFEL